MVKYEKYEYIKAFDDWFEKGNRLLKIGDTIFLYMYLDKNARHVHIYACDNFHTYRGWIPRSVFGKMISENRTRLLIDMGMNHISLYDFAWFLIYYDSRHSIDNTLFSFNQIDTGQLPEWIVKELIRQKLTK